LRNEGREKWNKQRWGISLGLFSSFIFFLFKKKKKDNWKETENLLLTYQRPNVIASFVFQEKLGE
jgi:hypothetical protein